HRPWGALIGRGCWEEGGRGVGWGGGRGGGAWSFSADGRRDGLRPWACGGLTPGLTACAGLWRPSALKRWSIESLTIAAVTSWSPHRTPIGHSHGRSIDEAIPDIHEEGGGEEGAAAGGSAGADQRAGR